MRSGLSVSFVDLTGTKRKSQNSSNWYTEIFDNHPEMSHLPKRSESMICTTDFDYAHGFGSQVYAILPVKNAKVAEIYVSDIWDLWIKIFGDEVEIKTMNDFFSGIIQCGLKTEKCSFGLLQEFDRQIKDVNSQVFQRLKNSKYSSLLEKTEFTNLFLESILKAYSPKVLRIDGSAFGEIEELTYIGHEVWFDTGAIIIPLDEWNKMRSMYRSSKKRIRNWQDLSEAMKNENI
jgi:hypothetical protein